MKKVLILTAEKTGTGHKSAANAIEKELNKMGCITKQKDCFTMMGKLGIHMEKSYIPMTIKRPWEFYIGYLFSQKFPGIVHKLIYLFSKKELKKEIDEFKPDIIITVHSMFTKAISKYIEKKGLNIPYYVVVIDLVNPPRLWLDKKANKIFVPTNEIKQDYMKKGIEEEKLVVSGFPIRSDIKRRSTPKKIEDKVNILMVNPNVNLKKNIKYVKEVGKINNANITCICGRDEKLYNTLIKKQENGEISKNIKIHGFVKNMNEFLEDAHILLTKAGPNMLLEGAKSSTAIIVTGHILGQENNNYEYVEKGKFGFRCEDPNKIYEKLNDFISSGKLNDCLKNVLKSECNDGTQIVVKNVLKKG